MDDGMDDGMEERRVRRAVGRGKGHVGLGKGKGRAEDGRLRSGVAGDDGWPFVVKDYRFVG